MNLAPGQVVAEDLGRRFELASGAGRSLKASLLRREAAQIHEFWALRHVDLDIEPGETFGIVGRNGSGKSTLLKMLARIFGPTEGRCGVGGRMSSLLELGAGFHPEFNAVENIYLAGAVYGIPKREIARDIDEIIGFAELERFAYQPIKTFSSGMFMRLGFSVAMHVRPDVLLLDEVLAVGDERFIQKCLGRIAQYRRDGGTMLLVTHDPGTVERLCARAMLLDQGRVITKGPAREVMATYHQRLAEQDNPADHAEPARRHEATLDLDCTVTDRAGVPHHQFVEAEPFTVAVTLSPHTPCHDATVEVMLRDELGREIGARSTSGVELVPGQPRMATLALDAPPLRNGLFQIDVLVTDSAGGATLLDARAVESVSVYGQADASDGPVQIGGTWRVD